MPDGLGALADLVFLGGFADLVFLGFVDLVFLFFADLEGLMDSTGGRSGRSGRQDLSKNVNELPLSSSKLEDLHTTDG